MIRSESQNLFIKKKQQRTYICYYNNRALKSSGSDKRQVTQFTPRLGRESSEDYFSYEFPRDQEELYTEEQIFPPLFAPRLGRKVPWTPSPRLGRQLHNIVDKARQNFDDTRF